MTTEKTIKDGIARSISHNAIVAVTVQARDIAEALSEVNVHAEDYDHARENDGTYDVWGTTEDGSEFRLRLTVEAAA